jgi:glutamate synthase domain-containing protein 3
MSGGIAYVWQDENSFRMNCNLSTVELTRISSTTEENDVRSLVMNHFNLTKSKQAETVLANWQTFVRACIKVLPNEYKAVISDNELSHVAQNPTTA